MFCVVINLLHEPSQVFINFAMGNFGMENVPINSEDENDDPASIKTVDA